MKKIQERNNRIDQLLQSRQDGLFHFAKATKELVDMGVKIGDQTNGEIQLPRSFAGFVDQFSRSNSEFEWLAEYKDGGSLPQFGPGADQENHFGNIDQSKLESISYISNFAWPTDNIERRVMVTLDWETGLFSFLNGFVPQEVKGAVCLEPIKGPKKLILLAKRRMSSSVGEVGEDLKPYHPGHNNFFYYNQFVLGFEAAGVKRAVLIQPTGVLELFEN